MLSEVHFGPRAQMGNHLSGREGTKPGTMVEWQASGQPMQKSCSEQIAPPGCIHNSWDRMRRDRPGLTALDDLATALRAGQNGDLTIGSRPFARRIEIGCL